ncbi:hypothetical protein H0H81_008549 [Sphagnurus paluster]|uniref:Uncharacterized protein n=1 Tax=Sphagnurus paluster TaxID=117069 RepID=A0A9P7KIZ8_9AGAR|nr:hypothetical protein H0H81_008549 [Sphagnurus paluster]
MSSTPRIDAVELGGVLAETLFYGFYVVLLIQCVDALRYRSRIRSERFLGPITITAGLLFCTITTRWLVDIALAFKAFIPSAKEGYCVTPNGINPAEKVYVDLSDPRSVIGSVMYVLTTLLGDGFMTYRLFIVWGRNPYIIIPPILMCIAVAIIGGMQKFWLKVQYFMGMPLPYLSSGKDSNLLASSVCVTVALGTYVGNSNVQFAFVSMINPVIGIIFCMIVSRAHRSVTNASQQSATNSRSHHIGHALRPMAVKITTQVQDVSDPKSGEFGTPPGSPQIYPMNLQSIGSGSKKEDV